MNKRVGLFSLLALLLLLLLAQYNRATQLNAVDTVVDGAIASEALLTQTAHNLEFSHMAGGNLEITAVQGNYLYTGMGSRFVVFDIANPAMPAIVGEMQLSATIREIVVNDNYAVVITASIRDGCTPANPGYYGGWYVIGLDKPSSPQPVFYQETDCMVRDITLSGQYLYLASRNAANNFLVLFDMTNPASPLQVVSHHLSLYAIMHLTVVDHFVYIIGLTYGYFGSSVGFNILDVSDPASPILTGEWDGPGWHSFVGELVVVDGYAYISITRFLYPESIPYLYILDVSNPELPTEVAVIDLLFPAISLTAVADTIYLTLGEAGVARLDITDPTQPVPAGALNTPGRATKMAVEGDFAYVADGRRGLRVLYIADPHTLSEIAAYDEIGTVDNITIADTNAYIAGHDMRILDLDDPTVPIQMSLYETGSATKSIAVSETMAILAGDNVELVDITDRYHPIQIGEYVTPGKAEEVALGQDQMAIADNNGGVHIVNIANPQSPSKVSTYNLGSFTGPVFVAGDYAYLRNYTGLHIVDISDETQPKLISQLIIPDISSVGDINVQGGYAFVTGAWEGDGLHIVDVNDPYQPFVISSVNTSGLARAVAVSGDYAYVADGNAGLQIISIADVANPQVIGSFPALGTANDVVVAEPYVVLADSFASSQSHVRILDVTNPITPTQVSSYTINAPRIGGMALIANELYIGSSIDSLIVLDISNPTNPVELGKLSGLGSTHSLSVSNSYAYLVRYPDNLYIVDVSDPAQPKLVATYPETPTSSFGLIGVDASNGRAYLINNLGFEVIDVTDPANPMELVTINPILPAGTISLIGDHLMVGTPGPILTSGHFNLVALNILTPTLPFQTDSLPGYIRQQTTRGDFAYVVDVLAKSWDWHFDGNLAIVDISDPTNLVRVSSYQTPGDAQGTAVGGNFVYIADGWAGLRVLDVWNPGHPVLAGSLSTPCFAQSVATLAEHIYVGCGEDGLVVVQNSQAQIKAIITAAAGGSLTHTDEAGTVTSIQVPPGAVTETVEIVLVPVTSLRTPPGIAPVQVFDLLIYQSGQGQPAFTFLQPVTLRITYTDVAVGIITDETELSLHWGKQGVWESPDLGCSTAPPVLDVVENRVTALICHNDRYALWGPTRQALLPIVVRP